MKPTLFFLIDAMNSLWYKRSMAIRITKIAIAGANSGTGTVDKHSKTTAAEIRNNIILDIIL